MKLHKKLISFYKKSKALEAARLQLKELKKSNIKLPKNKEITLLEIQDAIDHHMEIVALSTIVGKLPSDLLGIQRKVISVLKAISFPAKKVILINDEHYGKITFWYEGTYLYFEEQK